METSAANNSVTVINNTGILYKVHNSQLLPVQCNKILPGTQAWSLTACSFRVTEKLLLYRVTRTDDTREVTNVKSFMICLHQTSCLTSKVLVSARQSTHKLFIIFNDLEKMKNNKNTINVI